MAQWITVAQGTNLSDLSATIADMNLPKGTEVKVVMDTWAPWLFDVAGAELIFKPFIPNDVELVDVYGKKGQGIVDMEVDPPITFLAFLAFLKAHWLAITIAGLALMTIITFIIVMIRVPVIVQLPLTLILGIGLGIVGVMLLGKRKPGRI